MRKLIISVLIIMQITYPLITYAQNYGIAEYRKIEILAVQDSKNDLQVNNTRWTIISAGVSLLSTPFIGGFSIIIAANTFVGDISVPAYRIAEIEQQYPNNYLAIKVYEDKYIETYKNLKKKEQVQAAGKGVGISLAIIYLIYVKLTSPL